MLGRPSPLAFGSINMYSKWSQSYRLFVTIYSSHSRNITKKVYEIEMGIMAYVSANGIRVCQEDEKKNQLEVCVAVVKGPIVAESSYTR